ncbi:MAG: type II secretion system F family protein [Gemmatimonadaceae bacterium]
MPISLILLVALGVAAVAAAAYAVLADRARRQVIGRTLLTNDFAETQGSMLLGRSARTPGLRERLIALAPIGFQGDARTADKLVQAGYDGAVAPLVYATVRLGLLVTLPLIAGLFARTTTFTKLVIVVAIAAVVAYIIPVYYIERAVRLRQERLRRALPDGVDLLVLCVEAGLGFDAAILRVAREIRSVHLDLAHELTIVNRKVNAGVVREEALRAMSTRTGVREMQVLVQNLIQSEKLGSSIARVLRVYAETLRRKRRQIAEQKAAVAPLKMTFPLAGLILPAMFVVILGPAMLRIVSFFGNR